MRVAAQSNLNPGAGYVLLNVLRLNYSCPRLNYGGAWRAFMGLAALAALSAFTCVHRYMLSGNVQHYFLCG